MMNATIAQCLDYLPGLFLCPTSVLKLFIQGHMKREICFRKREKKVLFPSVIGCICSLSLKGAALIPGCTTCQLCPLLSHGELRAGKYLGNSWQWCRSGKSHAIKYAELGSDPRKWIRLFRRGREWLKRHAIWLTHCVCQSHNTPSVLIIFLSLYF